jgi:alpha-D-xyloside xylohydrolase
VWQIDMWQPGMGLVDFTNPAACEWFGDKLRVLLDMGVDAFKTDFGERIPTDAVYFDGADAVKMHNYYAYLYNQTVFDVLRERRGEGEAVVFARSATTGGQKFPVHWGGDCESSFVAMAESLRGGLSLGLSGFGFWSHDIGGFEGTPRAEIYKRWVAFGLLSSHSRLHGSRSYRVPWLFDEEAVEVLRTFTELKCKLMPYLYAHASEAVRRGIPMMRAMLLEFPDDPTCDGLDRQYMLGDSLLVAPVLSSDGAVKFYVPAGRWTNMLTGVVQEGPRWVRETHGFMTLPLLVRPNAVLAIGSHNERPDYDYGDGVTLEVYELEDGRSSTAVIPSSNGEEAGRFVVKRAGTSITVERQGESKAWRVLLVNVSAVKTVDGGTGEGSARGVLVTAAADSDTVRIEIG